MNKIKPTVLLIMDGFGERQNKHGNAIKNASLPCLNSLFKQFPHVFLDASGEQVGLPEGQIGNSEVGHLNIGAGRVVYTGLSLINKDIDDRVFETNEVLLNSIQHSIKNKSKLHLMGLLSEGGVHSSQNHIFKMIEVANTYGVEPIIHIFADGRDVAPKRIIDDIKKLYDVLNVYKAKIGTIAGRYYAMDRDKRFDRIEKTYNTLLGINKNFYTDLIDYVEKQYNNEIYDEFIEPATIDDEDVFIKDNDSIIFANFRPDRARQLSHFFVGSTLYEIQPKKQLKNLYFATMMNYEGINASGVLYPKSIPKNTVGHVIANAGLRQLRIAETEKYAHVTFFMDGGEEIDLPNADKILIPSPKVDVYDKSPNMSCVEITDKLLEVIDQYDFVILNYANADMLGHTGNYEKTIESLECMDRQIYRLFAKVTELNGTLFITSDHGNAEEMLEENGNPITKHTTNKVPFIITNDKINLIDKGNLSNIVPTILDYIDIDKPKEMSSRSLIKW